MADKYHFDKSGHYTGRSSDAPPPRGKEDFTGCLVTIGSILAIVALFYVVPVAFRAGVIRNAMTWAVLIFAIPCIVFTGVKLMQDPKNESRRNSLILIVVVAAILAAFLEFAGTP